MDVRGEPLTEPQVRILGVLVEKQLTTPQAYPLTEKALLSGCNQATNREPVVSYDSSVLRPALIRLRERGLARRVRRPGERADKHAHRLEEQLGLSSKVPLAALTVLLLRGAQTPGELRARTQRLQPLPDAAALSAALAELSDRGFAMELPRRPGEKQARWRHCLDASTTPPAAAPTSTTPPAAAPTSTTPPPAAPTSTTPPPAGAAGADPTQPARWPEAGTGVDDPDRSDDAVPSMAASAASANEPGQQPTLSELATAITALQQRVSDLERELGRRGPDPAAD
ncbi:MAG: DUF480 domain-containing protein [Actinomycetota bacterium]